MATYFLRHRVVALLSLVSFLLSGGGFLWAYFALRGVANAPLILHFDDIQGITSVGSMGTLIFMGILGLSIVLMNSLIAFELDVRDRFLGKLTAVVTLIFATLLFLAFSAIINVN